MCIGICHEEYLWRRGEIGLNRRERHWKAALERNMRKPVTKSVVRRRMDWQRLQEANKKVKEAQRRMEEADARWRRSLAVSKLALEAGCKL